MQLSQPPSPPIPRWVKMAFTGKLVCKHFQRSILILGKVWSFQIHLPWKSGVSRFSLIANKYTLLGSKSPFKLELQLLWFSRTVYRLSGVALIALRMWLGKTKREVSQHLTRIHNHLPNTHLTLTKVQRAFNEGPDSANIQPLVIPET